MRPTHGATLSAIDPTKFKQRVDFFCLCMYSMILSGYRIIYNLTTTTLHMCV